MGVVFKTEVSGSGLTVGEFGFYSFFSEWYRLKSVKKVDFFEGDSVISIKENKYLNNPLLPSEEITSNSQDEKIITHYTYAHDVSNPTNVEQLLIQQNRYEPIQVNNYMDVNNNGIVDSNDKFLNGQLTKYGIWSGKVLPEILKFTKEESVYESRVEYLSYDNYGNPTEVRQTDGTTVTYLWGYNGQYPVAKIANATYPEVINTGVDLAVLESISSSESAKTTELNMIRNHASMIDAMVTIYTYEPLNGVKTITDPKGLTSFYEYDDFNRLKAVKDYQGNLIEDYRYKYKN